jgi:hypothetical protein
LAISLLFSARPTATATPAEHFHGSSCHNAHTERGRIGYNMADDAYRELARRLMGAFMSYRMGIKSVDYTLKEYVGDGKDIHESWLHLAEALDHEMSEVQAKKTSGDKLASSRIQ